MSWFMPYDAKTIRTIFNFHMKKTKTIVCSRVFFPEKFDSLYRDSTVVLFHATEQTSRR